MPPGLRSDRGDTGQLLKAAAEGLPVVTIVGRANAGKSTLFNRIAGARRAIVSPVAGTTRDLNLARVEHDGHAFLLVDSGGLELGGGERLTERVAERTLSAVAGAGLVIFVLDGKAGLSAGDDEAFALIRATGCAIVAVVNKIDRPEQELGAAEFYRLGTDRLFFVSSAHGRGVGDLLDEVVGRLSGSEQAPAPSPDLRVALIGRPNVGKSSLLNRLAGFERSLVDQMPGTTRDPVDLALKAGQRNLLLIDTAGIRRRTRVEGELEHRSVARALSTIRRADVLLLVCDASEGITDQDARLARMVEEQGKGLVMICNKWDTAAALGGRVTPFVRDAHAAFPFLEYAPMVFSSALTGDGVGEIMPAALEVGSSWRATFQTAHLNRILARALAALDPPLVAGRRLKLMYITQVGSAPPRFALFANLSRDIPVHYLRFLESRLRAALGLSGVPVRIELRKAQASRAAGRNGRRRQAWMKGDIGPDS